MLLKRINLKHTFVAFDYFLTKSLSTTTKSHPNLPSIIREVYPYSNILITTKYNLSIRPFDLLDCQDSNLLRFTLENASNFGKPDIENALQSAISIDDKNVYIDTNNCLLDNGTNVNEISYLIEVPVRACLHIKAENKVTLENLYGDEICVRTSGEGADIKTKNLQAVKLNFETNGGDIFCDGTTLAHQTDIKVQNNNSIHLKKIQGDFFNAHCHSGTISTESCYANSSTFTVKNGQLRLSNVHKTAEIQTLDGGDIDVTGFHGILHAKSNGGNIKYQLTEIYGESKIEANNPETFQVNISEFVEEHSCLSVTAKEITLDETLGHLENNITKDTQNHLQHGNSDLIEDSLTIESDGSLLFGKLSWIDMVKLKLNKKSDIVK